MSFFKLKFWCLFLAASYLLSCTSKNKEITASLDSQSDSSEERVVSQEFKEYWFAGNAEITSYNLTQERYGELRDGNAVTIFVTEDFRAATQVKADSKNEGNIPVLKLNSTKDFITGIYPYTLMNSTFNPINTKNNALKITQSVLEWCGQTYMQLNNKNNFEVSVHSYFENEADQKLSLPKTYLENELWNLIRLNPEELPVGTFEIVPSFEFLRLRHLETKAYNAVASKKNIDSLTIYTLKYPEIQREFVWYFKTTFPFEIEKWEETNAPNTTNTEVLKTVATRLKRIKTAYWSQNKNVHEVYRDSLKLN